jgi:hypothetical protein
MSQIFPSWRDSNAVRHYPFTDFGPPTGGSWSLPIGAVLDANIHPPDASGDFYLSGISGRDNGEIVFTIGSRDGAGIATGTWAQSLPDLSVVPLYAANTQYPAGVLVVDPIQLGFLQSELRNRDVAFDPTTSAFVVSTWSFVNSPPPAREQFGVRVGVGDDLYLVGEKGIRLTVDESRTPPVVYVHAVGDPLARLRDCRDEFQPRFIREVIFQHGPKTVACKPNDRGEIFIVVVGRDNSDSALRLQTAPSELKIGFSS